MTWIEKQQTEDWLWDNKQLVNFFNDDLLTEQKLFT